MVHPSFNKNAGCGIMATKTNLTCMELFSGGGGLALGIEKGGFRHVAVVEYNENARKTIEENNRLGHYESPWPLLAEPDAKKVRYSDYHGKVDLIAGGPPCQPFSLGGLHKGYRDERDLFPVAVRAVREIEPLVFLFENVQGLTRPSFSTYVEYIKLQMRHPWLPIKDAEDWASHLRRLKAIDNGKTEPNGHVYDVQVLPISCTDFGTPQKRNRVLFVGARNDIGLKWEWPQATHSQDALLYDQYVTKTYWKRHGLKPKSCPKKLAATIQSLISAKAKPTLKPWVTVRDAISGLPPPSRSDDRVNVAFNQHVLIPGARTYAGHTGSPMDWPAKTIKAGVHGVPGGENMLANGNGRVRYFTVREAGLLQGFPDNYVFSGNWAEAMRQIGNAVPVMVAQTIAERLRDYVLKAKDQRSGD